jgi:hypothetical protein
MLGPTDHNFITDPSFVAYRHAEVYEVKIIERAIIQHKITEKEPLDSRVLALVCTGVSQSRGLAPRFIEIIGCQSDCKKCLL